MHKQTKIFLAPFLCINSKFVSVLNAGTMNTIL